MSRSSGRSEAGPCNKDEELASLMPSVSLTRLELVVFMQYYSVLKYREIVWSQKGRGGREMCVRVGELGRWERTREVKV